MISPTAARLKAIEECAALLENRFGERLQRRQAVQCLRSFAERVALDEALSPADRLGVRA